MKKAIIATLVFLVIVTLPFIVSAAKGNIGDIENLEELEKRINENPTEVAKRDGATQCVEKTDYMRVNHMQILKEERVNYVRHDLENDKHSIKGCFTCHDYDEFCQECHNYNGVEPGCLSQTGGCHSTEQPDYPRPEV
ncbi:MAG: hypothetical protein AB1760_18805 [Pseudomonadota bacterium]